MEDSKELLSRAADLIEEHGHLKGTYGNPEVGFCVAGAVWWAMTGRQRKVYEERRLTQRFLAALRRLPCGSGGVSAWNDSPRTTKETVIETLREAAA